MFDTHHLKTWPEPFQDVWDRRKHYEVRVFDRNYKVGDMVRLFEFNPDARTFTGRYCRGEIRYITKPGTFGLPANVGVFTVEVFEKRRIEAERAARWCSEMETVPAPEASLVETLSRSPRRLCNTCGRPTAEHIGFSCPVPDETLDRSKPETRAEWPGPYGLCADGRPHVPQPGSDPLMCGRCKNDLS